MFQQIKNPVTKVAQKAYDAFEQDALKILNKVHQILNPTGYSKTVTVTSDEKGTIVLSVSVSKSFYYKVKFPPISEIKEKGVPFVVVTTKIGEEDEIVSNFSFSDWFYSNEIKPPFQLAHETLKNYLELFDFPLFGEQQEEKEFSEKCISRDNQPDLVFEGKLICSISAPFRNGRNTIFNVYSTKSGKIVGVKIGQSILPGESTRHETVVGENTQCLVGLFGHTVTAKKVYKKLGIEAAERI